MSADIRRVQVAVVGVGALGRHHARILAALDDAVLVAVVDSNAARAAEVAEAYGTRAFTDVAALTDVDAVTIATPTASHHDLARHFLDRGTSVLVEKPLARTLAEAEELVAVASRRGVPLAVGHTERFNPAVDAALPFLTRPRFVEVHRLGTFSERSLDIDVVFDLMIHDLDLLLATLGDEVVSVDAVGIPVLSNRVDIANARLRFGSGCIANVTASRISREKVRKIRFMEPAAYVSIDYASQEVECWRLVRRDGGRPQIEGGKIDVQREEPLKRELADFVAATRDERSPRVTGEDGRRALALADRINREMTRHGH
ncbi:MAG: gfo/Idh/MocA family oxidoreductase [Luteitalea sp.]|nr:gfo/Idh/MocA family oxidoreductase [Luteitalea sp.]